MKGTKYLRVAVLPVLLFMAAAISAQETRSIEPQDGATPAANQQPDIRTNALRQLGLSREQAQQIRRLNVERKPLMDAAQQRLREANRSLDDAIYADQVNEMDVQARLKDLHVAQAEVARIRFMNELSVRKILTPEQLTRFRELRQRFEQARETIENRKGGRRVMNRNGDAFGPRQTPPVVRPNAQKPQP